MSSTWFSQIESTVFTYIQYMLVEKSDAPFPNLNCTTKSENIDLENPQTNTMAKFPTLYLHILQPIEQAQDLENDNINSVLATIEIQVFSNQSETEANKIMTSAISLMKNLRWNITMFPDPQTSDKISFTIARFRRLVTEGDVADE